MNDMTTRGGSDLASVIAGLKQSVANVQQSMPSGGGGDPYLRMGKDGVWVYGAESIEIENGSKWAIHPGSIQHGYVCWSRYDEDDKRGNEKLGEVMVPASQPLPNKLGLPDKGFPWTEQVQFHVACVSGADANTQTLYSCTSYGGMREVKERLLKAILVKIDAEEAKGAAARIVPIVTLENDHYNNKKWGKIYTPVFHIVDWASLDANSLPEDPAPTTNDNGGAPAAAAAPDEPRRRRARV
jgi:hypothetical protein